MVKRRFGDVHRKSRQARGRRGAGSVGKVARVPATRQRGGDIA